MLGAHAQRHGPRARRRRRGRRRRRRRRGLLRRPPCRPARLRPGALGSASAAAPRERNLQAGPPSPTPAPTRTAALRQRAPQRRKDPLKLCQPLQAAFASPSPSPLPALVPVHPPRLAELPPRARVPTAR